MKKIIIISIILGVLGVTACSSQGKKSGPDLKKASMINVQLGSAYLRQDKVALAKTKLEKALQQDADNALAHSTMALLLEVVGQHENIIDHYEEAISLDPADSDIKNNFGTYLCNQKRYEEAQKYFNIAINDPYYKTPSVALINAGQCALKTGKYKKAEAFLRKALRTNPKSLSALYAMASLGLRSQRYLMSRAYIQRYHLNSKPSAKSLWLQIKVEKSLGDRKEMRKLIEQMNKKFPDSDEAGLAMGLIR